MVFDADPRARRAAHASRSPRTSTSRSSPTPASFHHSNITPRTFDICRQTVEAGVNPAAMARRVFDSNSFGKLKLIGAAPRLDGAGRRRASRGPLHGRPDARGVRVHAQRHRGADQPAADRARDPGGRLLQGDARTTRSASACDRSTTWMCGKSRMHLAAAVTRTPPASRSRGNSPTSAPTSWRGSWPRSATGLQTRP